MTWHTVWTTLLIVVVAPNLVLAVALAVSEYRRMCHECARLHARLAEASSLVRDMTAVLDWYSGTQRMTDDERAWESEFRRHA